MTTASCGVDPETKAEPIRHEVTTVRTLGHSRQVALYLAQQRIGSKFSGHRNKQVDGGSHRET